MANVILTSDTVNSKIIPPGAPSSNSSNSNLTPIKKDDSKIIDNKENNDELSESDHSDNDDDTDDYLNNELDDLSIIDSQEIQTYESIEEPIKEGHTIDQNSKDKMELKASRSQISVGENGPNVKSTRLEKLAAMKLEVEEEARKKLLAQMGLNLESIKIVWDNYRDSLDSMSSKTALSNCIIDYKDKSIKVTVPNASTKGIVLQEQGLMEEIRTKFGLQDITLEVNIDPNLFPDIEISEINKKLNPREVHQLFAKKNPHFEQLIKNLKLKADNGSFG